jgi:hypothetical protein
VLIKRPRCARYAEAIGGNLRVEVEVGYLTYRIG